MRSAAAALHRRRDHLLEFRLVLEHRQLVGAAVARQRQRTLLRQRLLQERDAGLGWVALEDLVDETRRQRVLRVDWIARQDHAGRLLQPDETRQSLRATGARDEAELDLREC